MAKGGRRMGAGRPKGSGKFGEPTVPVRVPVSMAGDVERMAFRGGVGIPLFSATVRAGMPTAADDHVTDRVDLHEYLVPSPDSTFLVRAQGDSMVNAGIHDGDLLVVDKSLPLNHKNIVVMALDGDLTVKRIMMHEAGGHQLWPENEAYPKLYLRDYQSIETVGVVTAVVHEF